MSDLEKDSSTFTEVMFLIAGNYKKQWLDTWFFDPAKKLNKNLHDDSFQVSIHSSYVHTN